MGHLHLENGDANVIDGNTINITNAGANFNNIFDQIQ